MALLGRMGRCGGTTTARTRPPLFMQSGATQVAYPLLCRSPLPPPLPFFLSTLRLDLITRSGGRWERCSLGVDLICVGLRPAHSIHLWMWATRPTGCTPGAACGVGVVPSSRRALKGSAFGTPQGSKSRKWFARPPLRRNGCGRRRWGVSFGSVPAAPEIDVVSCTKAIPNSLGVAAPRNGEALFDARFRGITELHGNELLDCLQHLEPNPI